MIVALDATALDPALRMARRLRGIVRAVKVGSALFTACGPHVLHRLRALGFDLMLDLKFHDIPSTVALSCRAAVAHRVSRLTVHAAGGRDMLEAAVRSVRDEAKRAKRMRAHRPNVLAVTVLTSESVPPASDRVVELVEVALEAGCDGVVASAQEAEEIRRAFPRERFEIVCPGIRPSGALREDQRRTATPAEALRAGASALVVGRPITAARNPRAAAQQILSEMESSGRC